MHLKNLYVAVLAFSVLCTFAIVSPASAQDTAQQQSDASKANKANANKKASKGKKPSAPFKWVNKTGKSHESLQHSTFRSKSLGANVGYYILLPPEYSESPQMRFPTVYYLHGGRPGSEYKGIGIGKQIAKLQKAGKVSPVIYVFVNGGPVSHYNMPDDPKRQGADVFIKELIPHIDSTYRTIANRAGRGLEGFSQGGRGTMRLSLRHSDLFCSAAAGGGGYETEKRISQDGGYENPKLKFAEGDNTWDLARAYAKSDAPKVNWMIYVGTEGFNYKNNLEYMKFLDLLGITYERLVVKGVPHSAAKIYEKEALRIIRFHSANFTRTATLKNFDGNQSPSVSPKIRERR